MCTTCGNTSNWNYSTRRCGCGCNTIFRGQNGAAGATGPEGPSGGTLTTGVVVPHAGGSQGAATALTANDNLINSVITDGDSVKLLPALVNGQQQVRNYDATNVLYIYPSAGESIDALGQNIPYQLAAGGIVNFVCFTTGTYTT